MSIATRVESYLDSQHIDYELIYHPKSYSSRETARHAHIDEDHIAKAVVVKSGEGYSVAVIPGNCWLKMETLADEINRILCLAEETELSDLFKDCDEGAIPPIGQAYGLTTYFDERLGALENIYFEAGDHEHLIHIHGDEFHKLFKGSRHGFYSH